MKNAKTLPEKLLNACMKAMKDQQTHSEHQGFRFSFQSGLFEVSGAGIYSRKETSSLSSGAAQTLIRLCRSPELLEHLPETMIDTLSVEEEVSQEEGWLQTQTKQGLLIAYPSGSLIITSSDQEPGLSAFKLPEKLDREIKEKLYQLK